MNDTKSVKNSSKYEDDDKDIKIDTIPIILIVRTKHFMLQ